MAKDFESLLKRIESAGRSALERGVKVAGDELLRLAVRVNPHDEGTLQASANVRLSSSMDGQPEVLVGYNTKYAAKLHENPQFNFQKGRQGKYLSEPLEKNVDRFEKYIGHSLESSIRRA